MTRFAIVTAAALSLLAFASPAFGAARPYDFDGNGRQELAVGDPTYSEAEFPRVAGHAGAGIVVRTDANGLARSGQLLARGHDGFPGQTSNDVQLGRHVASGDFNGDGRADIALLKGTIRRGMVVLYGSPQGIRPSTAVNYNGDDTYFLDATAADVDGDRFDALAVRTARPSRVAISRGGPGGLPPFPSTALPIAPSSMRLADLNRDGHPELAYAEDGRVGVCRGTAGGLGACSSARSARAATD